MLKEGRVVFLWLSLFILMAAMAVDLKRIRDVMEKPPTQPADYAWKSLACDSCVRHCNVVAENVTDEPNIFARCYEEACGGYCKSSH